MDRWAQLICRTSWFWLIAWPVAALAIRLPAPRVSTLLHDDRHGFLPAESPSVQAEHLLEKEFPLRASKSRVAIVAHRASGLSAADRALLASLTMTLVGEAAEQEWTVLSSAQQPWLASVLENDAGTASLIVVELPAPPLTHHSVNRARRVISAVDSAEIPEGLDIEVTGSAALGALLDTFAKRDVDRTTIWSFVAVVAILLVIYRSPVAMFLPVLTILVALEVSIGLLGFAARYGLPLNGLVEMFIVVIIAGTGVDYCLFLFSRFREEMERHPDAALAARGALAKSGAAILTGAGTNAAALATLLVAGNRDLYTSGPTIAAAICVGCAAVLTFTPALLARFGRLLFWPRAVDRQPAGRLWPAIGRGIVHRPATGAAIALAVMLPLAWVGASTPPLFDAYEEFPADSGFVRGAHLYHHAFFGLDGVSDMSLILKTDASLESSEARKALSELLTDMQSRFDESLPLLVQRDIDDPLGTGRDRGPSMWLRGPAARLASSAYLGESGHATKIDFLLGVQARSTEAMDLLDQAERIAAKAVEATGFARKIGASEVTFHALGETAGYRDMRDLRIEDFARIAIAASALIVLLLVMMLRSLLQSLVLVLATLLTYLAAYGLAALYFNGVYGLEGLNWQIDFLLFIIIMSLGQDYNVFVVARVAEERRHRSPGDAIAAAVARTGGVVSSCGVIMAATFGSMYSGSLLVMKQFAVALAGGILIDTFLVRPVLVPAAIYLLTRPRRGGAARAS